MQKVVIFLFLLQQLFIFSIALKLQIFQMQQLLKTSENIIQIEVFQEQQHYFKSKFNNKLQSQKMNTFQMEFLMSFKQFFISLYSAHYYNSQIIILILFFKYSIVLTPNAVYYLLLLQAYNY
ncbi:unnamed protein product [Paramecium sonneborni]|uniref:Transmembrane protein n=1 Tax=Paramecium sonneborni TaxID=65129 RepID=A0A8S1RJ53_9CILI|nr:unnamed protein product [Paramecium sonneborni]